jgi:hypothetical protein
MGEGRGRGVEHNICYKNLYGVKEFYKIVGLRRHALKYASMIKFSCSVFTKCMPTEAAIYC